MFGQLVVAGIAVAVGFAVLAVVVVDDGYWRRGAVDGTGHGSVPVIDPIKVGFGGSTAHVRKRIRLITSGQSGADIGQLQRQKDL